MSLAMLALDAERAMVSRLVLSSYCFILSRGPATITVSQVGHTAGARLKHRLNWPILVLLLTVRGSMGALVVRFALLNLSVLVFEDFAVAE